MELPQPRPFGAEGRKSTHDFLSLNSPVQDPRSSQGGYLKTQDFLQPLESSGRSSANKENAVGIATLERPPPQAAPPSGEHLLPGGIGTYSISHISYFNQRFPKPEGGIFTVAPASGTDRNEENSNSSSYTGSGFAVWGESAANKGKTGKENIAGDIHVTGGGKIVGGQRMTLERLSQSYSSNTTATNHVNAASTFGSLSSFQPSSSQKNQTFMDMLKSAKVSHEEDGDDEEEFLLKKELSPQLKSDLTAVVGIGGEGGRNIDQKPDTPRSKHSATEQRRRSKINDRFQMLREIIPHSDQKRDKASFLLEVIEYIQYLQEKVHKYEGSYQGWIQEPPKLMPWGNSHSPAEGFVDQYRATNSGSGPSLIFPAKFDEHNINCSPTITSNGQNAVECDMSTATTLKAIDHHSGLKSKAAPLPFSLQPNNFIPGRRGTAVAPIPASVASDIENITSEPQFQFWQSRSCRIDSSAADSKLKEQELTIESGTISISSVYSQGLLNSLTQALRSSGVDLSQASISVKIDLGKRANSRLPVSTSAVKDNDVDSSNRVPSSGEESDQALKRLKTS